MPPAIQAEGLSKVYPGGVVGLRALSVEIQAGEMVGLLGPSGSGKTTFFRLLGGALRPTGGRLQVLGQDMGRIRAPALRRLRRRTGLVYQHHNLVPGLSAAHNVLLARLGQAPFWHALPGLFHLAEAERRAAFRVLQELEIGDKLYARADDLSAGQQQRVAVARALLHPPELLLADEPIASVDTRTAAQIMDVFQRLNRERGVTVVVSLHQPDFARHYCPRVLILARGELTYDGPPGGDAETRRRGDAGTFSASPRPRVSASCQPPTPS
ncbi:MAG: ATP-binding cassette domain-containing protein [Chloroflexi bacterium]|nr:ATP-binding cassette domain-containing protein [Chloroflexota bacterium]